MRISFKLLSALAFSSLLIATSCKKKESDVNNSNSVPPDPNGPTLLDYKKSDHQVYIGFLVGDGNDPYDAYNPANSPDSLDYLEFFAGRDSVTEHWREAQRKGTKIVVCHFLSDAYYDGSVDDPNAGDNDYNPNGNRSYNHWAKNMYNQHILVDMLDGIDLDVEYGTFGSTFERSAASGDSLITAVARYFGPNSKSGLTKLGNKPVFFYDTDGTGGFEDVMCMKHKADFNYILFQSYTTGNHAWPGTGVDSVVNVANYYGKDKLVLLVNGDSFKYPNGSEDESGGDAKATQDLMDFANWVKENNAAGVGTYRMSRDYNHDPRFSATRQAIQILNPAK